VGGLASLAPLDYDVQHEFYIPDGVRGAGGQLCEHIQPKYQVR
jgi:hypothetical protein